MTFEYQLNLLNHIRRMIPDFKCVKGCSECCGPVVFTNIEWQLIPDELRKTKMTGLDCPYLENNRCTIYEYRPIVCRLFGVTGNKLMRCPHGGKPQRVLTQSEEQGVMEKYHDLCRYSGMHVLDLDINILKETK